MKTVFLIFFHFFLSCLAAGEPGTSELLQQADMRVEAGLYEAAVPLYEEILKAAGQGDLTEKVSVKLAKVYLLWEKPTKAIETLQNRTSVECTEACLVKGLAHIQLNQFAQAATLFESLLEKTLSKDVEETIQYHLAYSYLKLNQAHKARSLFLKIVPSDSHFSAKAQLYLVRLDLLEGKINNAIESLKVLEKKPQNQDVEAEVYYLKAEIADLQQDYEQATYHYLAALKEGTNLPDKWRREIFFKLAKDYVNLGKSSQFPADHREKQYERAEEILKKLLHEQCDEQVLVQLAKCFYNHSELCNNPELFQKAEDLLSKHYFERAETKAEALLLKAQKAKTFEDRQSHFTFFLKEFQNQPKYYSDGLIAKALNEFNEAKIHLEKSPEKAQSLLCSAYENLKQANTQASSPHILKYQAEIALILNLQGNLQTAQKNLEHFLQSNSSQPEDLCYLNARLLEQLDMKTEATSALNKLLELYPKGAYADQAYQLLGTIFYKDKQYENALNCFLKASDISKETDNGSENLFWAARCADRLQDKEKSKKYRLHIVEKYPNSEIAPEAAFTLFTFQEYLQGDRNAIKHLETFVQIYPTSPLAISAWYLIGLDHKRDRKSLEGKWISRKNLIVAIDAFQKAETLFDNIASENLENLEFYATIRYQASLEKALANMAIADDSQGAKRHIYLEYAQELFKQSLAEFNNSQHFLYHRLFQKSPFFQIKEETHLGLIQALVKGEKDTEAKELLQNLLQKYESAKIARGYYLSKLWYEMGMLAFKAKDYKASLASFKNAEETGKGKILPVDQKLELWIQESLCYRNMNNYEEAILTLSKVINEDAISSLRIKAMYLRAETYTLLGKKELARRQLEATAKQSGEWAQKAQELLREQYYAAN